MPRILHHIIALTALVACSRPAADTHPAGPPTTGVAAGSVALAPRDTISERADRGRLLGDSTAKVWVIMASDFQCPYCKQWHDRAFSQVVKTYVKTGRARLAFLNMPLSIHPNAVPAAEAAMCASVQNKFWPMHEELFATQSKWESLPAPDSAFAAIAQSVGVNMILWRKCVSQHLTLPLIQADHDRAIAAHVNSTPTFFVGDAVLSSADADVPAAIDAALKAKTAKKPGH